jgi:predicted DNA-binding transcriptional regulator AlpA
VTHEPDLSVAEVAAMVGVTRARVYQRINGETGAGEPARRVGCLPSHRRALTTGGRMVTRVPLHAALAWRERREGGA